MPQQYFSDMLNLEGFDRDRASGSARDYFIVSSAGVFTPQFDVVGPVTLPHTQAYYGRNEPYDNANASYMIPDACDILAAQGFDFSIYDCDNDGEIDNVYLIYAGRGESSGNLVRHQYRVASLLEGRRHEPVLQRLSAQPLRLFKRNRGRQA